MKKSRIFIVLTLIAVVTTQFQVSVFAHSGRTDKYGGHNSPSGYHYHNGGGSSPSSRSGSNSSTTSKTISSTSVKITKPSGKVYTGSQIKLNYVVSPSNTTNKNITWSSSSEKIAKVSSDGTLIALSSGEVTITAKTSNGKTDEFTIDILDVNLNYTKKILVKNESFNLILNGANSADTIQWSSSDSSIVAVTTTGKIIGKAIGKATIYAEVNNKIYKCEVIVLKYRIDAESTTLKVKDKLELTVKGDTNNKTLIWSTSDSSVATVSKDGILVAKNVGTVIISLEIDNGVVSKTFTIVE